MSTIEEIIKSTPEFRPSRLSSLYSDFEKLKILNPIGYEANIQAWKTLLLKLISSHKLSTDSRISFKTYNPDILQLVSLLNYGKPQSLGIVINELVAMKVLVPESFYLASKQCYLLVINESNSFMSPKSWLKWGLQTIGLAAPYNCLQKSGKLIDDRFIAWNEFIKLAEEALTIVQQHIDKEATYSAKLFNFETLYNLISSHMKFTTKDLELILMYWSRDIAVCKTTKLDDITYIKFTQSEPLSEDDIRIIDIQATLYNLNNRTTQLSTKLSKLKPEFAAVVQLPTKDQQKIRLRHLLTQRQILTKSLESTSGTYTELYNILQKINDSDLNVEIYKQLVSSSVVLKNMNSRVSIEDVDDVKADIEREVSKSEEINEALVLENDLDDAEIDEELQLLIKEDKQQEEEAEAEVLAKLSKLNIADVKPITNEEEKLEQDAESTKVAIEN